MLQEVIENNIDVLLISETNTQFVLKTQKNPPQLMIY